MNNKLVIGIIVALIVLAGGYILISSGPTVSAIGTSSIKVQPDQVSVNIEVVTRNITAQDAQNMNKDISDKLLTELIKLGFDKSELQFVNYYVNPDYDYTYQKQKGYIVSQQLVVKTDSVERVPSIVDAAINSGALVSYINFETSQEKQNEYKAKALEEASKDGMVKASSTAAGLGKKLGRLVSVKPAEFNYPGPIMYYDKATAEASGANVADSARSAALNIKPQDTEISASVTVEYKLSYF